MANDTHIWLERISSLHRSLIRKAVNEGGLQFVHFEIMHYLSVCNRYSNTAQALTEYLGHTKGSISQSLKFLESREIVLKTPDPEDKRFSRLSLSEEGAERLKRMNDKVMPKFTSDSLTGENLKQVLMEWQEWNQLKGFGQCITCKYNIAIGESAFQCGLTGEALSLEDTELLCKEHEFSS